MVVIFGIDVILYFNLGDEKGSIINKIFVVINDICFEGGVIVLVDVLKKVKDVVVFYKRFGSDGVLIFIIDGKLNMGGFF